VLNVEKGFLQTNFKYNMDKIAKNLHPFSWLIKMNI